MKYQVQELQKRSLNHFDFKSEGTFYQMSLEKEETVRAKIENQETVYLNELIQRSKAVRHHEDQDFTEI